MVSRLALIPKELDNTSIKSVRSLYFGLFYYNPIQLGVTLYATDPSNSCIMFFLDMYTEMHDDNQIDLFTSFTVMA